MLTITSLGKSVFEMHVVEGNEGPSLQSVEVGVGGTRLLGPKAWGNVYNKPKIVFKVEDPVRLIKNLMGDFRVTKEDLE